MAGELAESEAEGEAQDAINLGSDPQPQSEAAESAPESAAEATAEREAEPQAEHESEPQTEHQV
jgi:hypothetical protein